MTAVETLTATAGYYRPLDYTETRFDPPIRAPEAEQLFLSGSLAGGTVATIKPEDVIGIADNILIPFVPVIRVNQQGAVAGYGFALEFVETAFEAIVPTGEASAVTTLEWPPVAPAQPVDEAVSSGPPAFRAFKDLVRWLEADDADVTAAVGVGRTTPYSWRRDDREPRASTVRCLYEYHAVVSSLRSRLGAAEFRRWLFSDDPAPRERLLAGDLKALEARIHALLLGRHDTGIGLGWAPEDAQASERPSRAEPLRPSGRKPRRARVP